MHYIVAVFDVKAESFAVPVFVKAKGLAIRSFIDAVNGSQTDLSSHPEDFCLYCLGTFDELTATIIPLDDPEVLMSGGLARSV